MLPMFLDIERTLRTHCSLIEHRQANVRSPISFSRRHTYLFLHRRNDRSNRSPRMTI
jgi:hypothetical protein